MYKHVCLFRLTNNKYKYKLEMPPMKLRKGFLCLHLGAGFHSETKQNVYKQVCEDALQLGVNLLNNHLTCVDVATKVVSYLENSKLTNAGFGSNLTKDGSIECEAAIMESTHNTFAAVGCVQGLKNPVQAARVLLHEQQETRPLGLVAPMVLVGNGVLEKAKEYGLETIDNKSLISEKALKDHKKFKTLLTKHETSNNDSGAGKKRKTMLPSVNSASEAADISRANLCKAIKTDTCLLKDAENHSLRLEAFDTKKGNSTADVVDDYQGSSTKTDGLEIIKVEELNVESQGRQPFFFKESTGLDNHNNENELESCFERNDTIGVICIDSNLEMATAVSSGGLALKQSGRLGPCTQFGAGCWAFKYDEETLVGCCCSGTGEAIMRTQLAENVSRFIYKDPNNITELDWFTREQFTNSPYISSCLEQRQCGLLLVTIHKDIKNGRGAGVDFYLTHTTDSFCVGYITSGKRSGNFIMSRLKENEKTSVKGFHFVV